MNYNCVYVSNGAFLATCNPGPLNVVSDVCACAGAGNCHIHRRASHMTCGVPLSNRLHIVRDDVSGHV